MTRDRLIAIGQTMAVIISTSFGGVLVKLALSDVPAFTFVWLQIGIGGAILTFYTFVIRGVRIPRGLSREVWFYIIAIGVGNFTIVRVLFMFSLERLPATTNQYLLNFVGIVTMAMSIFILREAPTVFQVIGALTALTGLYIFFDEVPPPSEMVGIVLVAIGVLALAYTNNIARKLAVVSNYELDNTMISNVALLIGGLPVVLAGLLTDWPPKVTGWANWGIVMYSSVFIIAFGLTVWNYILRTLRSYEASVLGASSVIWTAIFAIPILGEHLAINQIIGIALMFVGLTLVQVRRGKLRNPFNRNGTDTEIPGTID